VKTIRDHRYHVIFVGIVLSGLILFAPPLISLCRLVLAQDSYSHIAVIPFASLFFIWSDRKVIFTAAKGSALRGVAVGLAGLALYDLAYLLPGQFENQAGSNDYLTLTTAGAVAWVIGSFIFSYGPSAFKRARFSMLLLVLAIPIPVFILHDILKALQAASAETADIIFQMLPVTYRREGLIFQFPNVAIEVAEQCSGIRSSLALFVGSVIAGKVFLKRGIHRAALTLSILPITILKNALRIITITLLANYVDLKFITHHWIHSSGGILFLAVAIAMSVPVVWLLHRREAGRERVTG
jgi:exosortase